MKNRTVKHLIPAYDINMGGTILKQALPTNQVPHVDPFLLLHHAEFHFTADAPAIHQGLGPHPHRGFTPVTFVIDGEVHHRDSRGNNQIAKKGEVQWMHAGAGIIHSERPSQALAERNGRQEVIQLWINSPATRKMEQPHYQHIAEENIPLFESNDKQIRNKLIAGNYNKLQGKIKTESELIIIWSLATEGGVQTMTIPEHFNTILYLIKGKLKIDGYGLVEHKSLVVFENDASAIGVTALESSDYLLLSGVPIKEKIVQQGPFVMNSETEILRSMRDYQMGKMGILIEEK